VTETPTLTGQDINVAARAVRRLLDALLDEAGITFAGWVAVLTLAQDGPAIRRDVLQRDLAENLQADASSITELLDQLESTGLVREASDAGAADAVHVRLTPDGEALVRRLQEGIGRITAELYSGFDPTDLATTRRVLVEVTERANARLAR